MNIGIQLNKLIYQIFINSHIKFELIWLKHVITKKMWTSFLPAETFVRLQIYNQTNELENKKQL